MQSRRAFLTTIGSVAVAGCTGTGRPSRYTTTTTSPTTNRDESPTTESTTTTEHPATATIGFGGDTMVGRTLNDIYGQDGVDPASIWGDLESRLAGLDGVCCNLECCLSTRGERFPGRAYYFRGDPAWAIPALTAGNIRFASLANNHTLDYGVTALTDTIDQLEDAGIAVAGAGQTPTKAREPATFTAGGIDVAVVSLADRSAVYEVSDDRAGIAYAETDPDNEETQQVVGDAIAQARAADPDLLVVSIHWGPNWVERPKDRLVAFGHWLVDQGVDLVHGHSAHVVQGIEQYEDGVILHDTGDLVDDFGVKDDLGNDKSFLFEVTVTGGDITEIRLVPTYIDDGVTTANPEQAAWLRETMRRRSKPFDTTYERDGQALVVRR